MTAEIWVYCLRIIAAAAVGGLLGFERSKKFKSAGVRIYSIVCTGSALLMVMSFSLPGTDTGRIAAQVVGGISFICLAIIYRQGHALRGLSTAAGLWVTSAVGQAIGAGMYHIALAAALSMLFIQVVLGRLNIDSDSASGRDLTVRVQDAPGLRNTIIKEVTEMGANSVEGRYVSHLADGTVEFGFVVKSVKDIDFEDLVAMMDRHPEIKDVKMQH